MASKYVMDKDLGMKKIMQEFRNVKKAEMLVGIQEGSFNGDGANIAEYGTYNEFGTDDIPSRPFMRTAFDENRPKYVRYMEKATAAIGEKTFASIVHTLGMEATKDIQSTITKRNFLPALSPYTVAQKKGSTKTLVDTGAMVNSIRHIIRK